MGNDMVLRARVLLLGSHTRVLRGPDALWVYRLLARVDPEVYGSKLAHVLVEAAGSPLVQGDPQARRALLKEAVTIAEGLSRAHPYREKVLARALAALAALDARSASDV